jgi:tetratricopeptide (TPR) repeat protein
MSERVESRNEEKFERMVTVLIASVAIWVAITVYFQNYAANLSDQARRRAQENAIASTKTELNGSIQYSYEWQGAFQTWKELGWQITAAEQSGDSAAVERYTKLQERIAAINDILSPKYFDTNVGWPDSSKYEADLYLVESTRLSEIYIAEAELGTATDNTADALVVQITLLTVALSLYGLSMALKGRVRWLFVIIGSGIVGFCMLWLSWSMLELFVRPEVNNPAINAYSEGVGLAYQGKYDEAISKFNTAIAEKYDYGKAYYERGFAYYYKGDLATAIADFESARNAGLEDTTTNWNLGWVYYLSGQYSRGIEADERVLTQDPAVVGVRMNEAISYLAMGDLPNAQQQYDLLVQEAERQVNEAHQNNLEPSASLWYYMDAGAIDLQNLIDQLDNNPKSWTEAPSETLIPGDHAAIRDFAFNEMKRLKETTVALEYTGRLPAGQSALQVQAFKFGRITDRDDQGLVVGFESAPDNSFAYGTESVTVEYTYDGPAPKQIIWKVYVNGREDQSLRVIQTDNIGSGTIWYRTFGYNYTNVFILTPGEYTVELYADSNLVQMGQFIIREE